MRSDEVTVVICCFLRMKYYPGCRDFFIRFFIRILMNQSEKWNVIRVSLPLLKCCSFWPFLDVASSLLEGYTMSYCWWKKCFTTWDVWNPSETWKICSTYTILQIASANACLEVQSIFRLDDYQLPMRNAKCRCTLHFWLVHVQFPDTPVAY